MSLLHHHDARRPAAARGPRLEGRPSTPLLEEHAADLLLAARGLRAMAAADGTPPALAATLGCVEAAIDALADALVRLRPHAAGPLPAAADELRAAGRLTGRLRERVGPALAGHAAAPPAGSRRDPAHVVFDHACRLTAAASAIRAASGARPEAGAAAATLRCVGTTLEALGDAMEAFGARAGPEIERGQSGARWHDVAWRLRRAAGAALSGDDEPAGQRAM
ncbi:MAG TPA: hypothetical protein VFR97_08810 [Capillimicrobium sp.]|nr:hypothetical protein [Capillimicrobium sp.]